MKSKTILIFNEDPKDKLDLKELFTSDDIRVLSTSRVLEAIHILKHEDVAMVIAPHSLNNIESDELIDIVHKTSPGVQVSFIEPSPHDPNGVSLSRDGLKEFLHTSLRNRCNLNTQLADLKGFCFSFADRLLQIFGANDKYFFNNDHMVAKLARKTAARMGLDPDMQDSVHMAGLLKDIGRVGIHNKLLEDNKRFSRSEHESIRNHPLNAVQMLRDVHFPWDVASIIAQHHETYDGNGYPAGLKGREICIGARIIHIADSFVAMTTDRPYRKALGADEALNEIVKKAGTQFDPEVAETFIAVINEEPLASSSRKSILVLERHPVLSALIRLCINANEVEVLTAQSTFDAVRHAKLRNPELIIADSEMLEQPSFIQFIKTILEIPAIRDKHFILIFPDIDHPTNFNGHKFQYLVKPVEMRDLIASINRVFGREAAVESRKFEAATGLSGNLDDFSLIDIIQILSLGLKTAMVTINSLDKEGIIYVASGKVVSAFSGLLYGKEAFYEIASWEEGKFQILHGKTSTEGNIKIDTMHLIMEAVRIKDEMQRHLFGL